MEDPVEYRPKTSDAEAPAEPKTPVPVAGGTDFAGVEAAMKRAAANAIRRAREAGLEPVVSGAGKGEVVS